MLKELKLNENVYIFYLQNIISRAVNGSMVLEYKTGKESVQEKHDEEVKYYYLYGAFNYLLNGLEVRDSKDILYALPDLIKILTGGEYDNYRNVEAIVINSKVERTHPSQIRNSLYYLFDNYEKMWDGLDPFEKEARFHIDFLRIHPFGDGNGRIGRLITTYNFIRQDIAPPIVTSEYKKEYCGYIEERDYKGMAEFMKRLSKKEEQIIAVTNESNLLSKINPIR